MVKRRSNPLVKAALGKSYISAPTDAKAKSIDENLDSLIAELPPETEKSSCSSGKGVVSDAIDEMKIAGFPLTEEQKIAVRLALKNESLKISAFAGAGKTSTLKAISEAKPQQRGLYLAFNRSIADEAGREFPNSVSCRTAHSLAYGPIGSEYAKAGRLRSNINGSFIVKELSLGGGVGGAGIAAISSLAMQTVTKFCQGGSDKISTKDCPWSELFKIENEHERKAVAEEVLRIAKELWKLMNNKRSKFPITHDVYLKIWALTKPTLHYDYILFDEAQDANGVMLSIVENQASQKIYVGDKYQQIYSWRGAVNAMSTIETEHECVITQSFRFGEAVADVANHILSEYLFCSTPLIGFEKVNSTVINGKSSNEPDVYICRTNALLISSLQGYIGQGKVVYVEGGVRSHIELIKAIEQFRKKKKSNHPELMLFQTYQDFLDFIEDDNAAGELKVLYRLIKSVGYRELIELLEACLDVDEADADITLTTAHKSKGREWDNVLLGSDFRMPKAAGGEFNSEELNLLYVAVTRAKKVLDISETDLLK